MNFISGIFGRNGNGDGHGFRECVKETFATALTVPSEFNAMGDRVKIDPAAPAFEFLRVSGDYVTPNTKADAGYLQDAGFAPDSGTTYFDFPCWLSDGPAIQEVYQFLASKGRRWKIIDPMEMSAPLSDDWNLPALAAPDEGGWDDETRWTTTDEAEACVGAIERAAREVVRSELALREAQSTASKALNALRAAFADAEWIGNGPSLPIAVGGYLIDAYGKGGKVTVKRCHVVEPESVPVMLPSHIYPFSAIPDGHWCCLGLGDYTPRQKVAVNLTLTDGDQVSPLEIMPDSEVTYLGSSSPCGGSSPT